MDKTEMSYFSSCMEYRQVPAWLVLLHMFLSCLNPAKANQIATLWLVNEIIQIFFRIYLKQIKKCFKSLSKIWKAFRKSEKVITDSGLKIHFLKIPPSQKNKVINQKDQYQFNLHVPSHHPLLWCYWNTELKEGVHYAI